MTTDPLDTPVSENEIKEIETGLLQGLLGCRTTEAVEAAVTYAAFLSTLGVTPDTLPIFLRMLQVENHWVIDALIGGRDPFVLLSAVQPDRQTVSRLFAMLTRWQRGNIYHKNLMAILGVLQAVYASPGEGYQVYPVSIQELNALGKHLDKEAGQDHAVSRTILDILGKLAEIGDGSDAEAEDVAIHASAIRNAFYDDRRRMEDAIPPILLVSQPSRAEIPPRKRVGLGQETGKKVAVVVLDEEQAKTPARKPPAPKAE